MGANSLLRFLFGQNVILKKTLPFLVLLKCRIYNVIFGFLNFIRYTRRIKSVKYVHLMWNDKFNKPFVDFLNKYFCADEHFVICRNFESHPVPIGHNVAIVRTYWGFGLHRSNIKWIYTHSLGDWQLLDYFYHHRNVLHKSCWIVWGGTDNFYRRRDKYVMRVCPYFGMYSVGADTPIIQKTYNAKGGFVDPGGYQFPIKKEMLDRLKKTCKNVDDRPVVVQINHSGDGSTLEMLDVLAKFRRENLIVRTVLSYTPPGGQGVFVDKIKAKGRDLFGDKFQPVLKFMDAEAYAASLLKNDILIMNQPRSQGFGNIIASLYLGKKVYIRSDVSSYRVLRAEGAAIHDTVTIKDLSWSEFVAHPESESRANESCALSRVDDKILATKYAKAYGWRLR